MPKFILGLLLALISFPFISSAQTPDCISYRTISAKTPPWNPVTVTPPSGYCTGPIKTPVKANPNGKCNWGYYPNTPSRPASATATKWLPDQGHAEIWFWEDKPDEPGTYDVNWGSCDVALQWSPNSDVGVKIKVNPVADKYTTGQVLRFSPESNVLTHLDSFYWNLGDGIERPNETSREQPVVYTKPGKKVITLTAFDRDTNSNFSASLPIRVKCVPPAGSTDDVTTITNSLNNYQRVNVAASSFRQWAEDNKSEIENYLLGRQCTAISDLDLTKLLDGVNTINYLSQYLGQKKAASVFFALPSFNDKGFVNHLYYHAVVGLNFELLQTSTGRVGSTYQLEFLDPNGPQVVSLKCVKNMVQIKGGNFSYVLECPYETSPNSLKKVYVLNPKIVGVQVVDIDALILGSLPRNSSDFLRQDYLLIDNMETLFSPGVCAAWSDLSLRAAYLGKFVGECASLANPAAVGLTDLSELLLKLREFLSGQLPLLSR